MKSKSVLDPFSDLFKSQRAFRTARLNLERQSFVTLDNYLFEARYSSLELRAGKAGFVRGVEIHADWCYNTTPPIVLSNADNEHFLVAQWNGPCLNHYTICKGKVLARAFLISLKSSVIILKKPSYEERVRKALRLPK